MLTDMVLSSKMETRNSEIISSREEKITQSSLTHGKKRKYYKSKCKIKTFLAQKIN